MKFLSLGSSILAVALLDFSTKFAAQNLLQEPLNFGWGFGLEFVFNPNLAFGVPAPFWLIIVLACVALIMLGFLFRQSEPKTKLLALSLILIFGGAVGNLGERILFGAVTDFLKIPFLPNFNCADTAIFLGILLYFVNFFKISAIKNLADCD